MRRLLVIDYGVQDNPNPPPVPQTTSSRVSDVTARLQHLRNLLNSERSGGNADSRRAIEALDREMREMSGEPISSRLERRRRELEAQVNDHDTVLTAESPNSSPSSLSRSRRRAFRPSERLLRHRERLNLAQGDMDEIAPVVERPHPLIESAGRAAQEYLEEAQVNRENRWRAKRRKLDDGTFEEDGKTFSYGHKGQVVPGPLKLDIISCDGGEYFEPNVGHSLPQHVLQDDNTVYCTKGNRCNMLLKHVGGMPISLTKLVIKAPEKGYDAPIQEGMIFVALDEDKLVEKTEQYEIRYSPRSYRYHYRRPDSSDLRFRPSREYLNSARPPLHYIDRSRYLHDPYPPPDLEEIDRLLDPPLVPGFNISTSFDDSSDTESRPRRESWQETTFPNFNFDPSRLLRTYVDDHYRPSYDRIAYSDVSPSSSDSEHDDSISELNQDTATSPRVGDHPTVHRDRERLIARPNSRPISRHGVPPTVISDQMADLLRQRQLFTRMRLQRGEWDRWAGEYYRMEMDQGSTGSNRRSIPSRIEIRGTADTLAASSRQVGDPSDSTRDAYPGLADGPTPAEDSRSRNPRETTVVGANTTPHHSQISPAPAPIPAPTLTISTPTQPPTAKTRPPTTLTPTSAAIPLAPHARFFIRRDKSVVSIKFDPPVAGRYILIKLWASCPHANIDIQSIVAHGYGGPRFFPSQEMR